MSKGKYPYVPTPEDVPAPDLSYIFSPESKNSSNKMITETLTQLRKILKFKQKYYTMNSNVKFVHQMFLAMIVIKTINL